MRNISMMSPQEIASKYGGDKRKIAQAVQMGVLDPTTALMAGMLIDRIRASAAQEQQPQQTVAEEMFNQPEPAAMASGGLAGLPVPDSMFDERNYASGGVVAFANRGAVDLSTMAGVNQLERNRAGLGEADLGGMIESQQGEDPFYAKGDEEEEGGLGRARKYVDLYRQMLASAKRGPEYEAMKKFYEGAGERAEKAVTQARAAAGLTAAGKLLSTRGSLSRGLGAAAESAAPGLQKANEMQAAAEEAAMKARLGLAEKERGEELEAIKGGMGLYGKEREREITAGKDLRADKYVKRFVAAAKYNPELKDLPQEVLEQMGEREFLNLSGASLMRGQAALGGLDIKASQLGQEAYETARNAVKDRIKSDFRLQNRLSKMERDDPAAYEAEISRMVDSELARMRGSSGGAAPAPAAKPSAAPAAKPTGAATPKAGEQKFSVTAPNGQVFNFATKQQADAFKQRIGAAK